MALRTRWRLPRSTTVTREDGGSEKSIVCLFAIIHHRKGAKPRKGRKEHYSKFCAFAPACRAGGDVCERGAGREFCAFALEEGEVGLELVVGERRAEAAVLDLLVPEEGAVDVVAQRPFEEGAPLGELD